MNTKVVAALSALLLDSSSALAQETCDPTKLSVMVDTYASNPFGARTWRVLNGLGDCNAHHKIFHNIYYANYRHGSR